MGGPRLLVNNINRLELTKWIHVRFLWVSLGFQLGDYVVPQEGFLRPPGTGWGRGLRVAPAVALAGWTVCWQRTVPAPESYFTHQEWIIEAFTLQYPYTSPTLSERDKNPKTVKPSLPPYKTIWKGTICLKKCFRVVGFTRSNVRLTVHPNLYKRGFNFEATF